MPKYRFTWDPFDDESLTEFAGAFGWDMEGSTPARTWLEANVKGLTMGHLDDEIFFDAVRFGWLPKQKFLGEVVEELISRGLGPGGRPRAERGYRDYLKKVRRSAQAKQVLLNWLKWYGDPGPTRRDGAPYKGGLVNPWRIVPAHQPEDSRKPHSYQKEAWDKLSAALARHDSGGEMRGLLVMPTGSGKTYTAVRWLVERVLNRGGRVLWLAHRTELLEQATREFQRLACFARSLDEVKGRLVGGGHLPATTIDPRDHVTVSSIALLARNPDYRQALLKFEDLHIVIDEAHHAPAKSYRDLIQEHRDAGGRFLLGLTATPTRTLETERPELARLFGNAVFHQVDMRNLIERGILSRPVPVQVETNADVEKGVTAKDRKHLANFHELSEAWLNRIAKIKVRNEAILQHYLEHKQKYGKTLVFAINIAHAESLKTAFEENGIAAEYVASRRPDGSDGDPGEIIGRFRRGEFDVLINVQMLTEGVDVPDVQTVFLARPTASETLVRQMIGRALRGPQAGGTERAYLVSFEDHWERYREWQSPLALVEGLTEPEKQAGEAPPKFRVDPEYVPHDLIHAVLAQLRLLRPERPVEAFEAVPAGHYVIERITDRLSERRVIAVFEHQKPFWEAFIERLGQQPADQLWEALGGDEFDDEFADCDVPRPAQDDIDAMMQHFADGGSTPAFLALAERDLHDPRHIAREVRDGDLGPRAMKDLVAQRYNGFAKAVYASEQEFYTAIQGAVEELEYGSKPPATVNFIPLPDTQLKDDKPYDLSVLMKEVLGQGMAILGVGDLIVSQQPEWSRRPVKSWWGHAQWRLDTPAGHGRLRINRLLNSSGVSEDAIKYLLWHEYLHLHLKQGHTKEFRRLEKLWPSYMDWDREIDQLAEKYDIASDSR